MGEGSHPPSPHPDLEHPAKPLPAQAIREPNSPNQKIMKSFLLPLLFSLGSNAANDLRYLPTLLSRPDHRPTTNQRQIRKNRRRAWAAGNRFAFS